MAQKAVTAPQTGTRATALRHQRAGQRRRTRTWIEAYILISPWLLGFVVLTLIPFVTSLAMSFTKWPILGAPEYIGLANYERMFLRDRLFSVSLLNTLYYAFLSVPADLVLAFFLAALLNQKVMGLPLFRTLFYIPSITAGVASAVLWSGMFDARYGIVNLLLGIIGIEGPNWLGTRMWAKPAFVIMSLWYVGRSMVIFLAGLQGVSQHLYEAAEVDGAGAWRKVRHITIPMLTPTIFFNLVMGIIGSFGVFTTAYVITEGGPADATLFYVLYLYRNAFQYYQMGYASALAWVFFLIVLAFTLLQLVGSRRWVYYEQSVGRV